MVVLFWLFLFVSPLMAVEPFLKLEPVFEGTTPLYPGQTATIGYRYIFNASIDLLDEQLPLLEAKGFKKLGDKQIKEGQEKEISISQVTQSIEAIKPGDYILGPSLVSGYAYTLDKSGNKQYHKPQLVAKLPEISIKVSSFPSEGKPGSFQGALGKFSFQSELLSPHTVNVGEKIELQLQVKGNGYWNTVLPPELCCQPGFSGFFKVSDLPPATEAKSDEKNFTIELFVENSAAKTIPPIEFSFFDPTTKTYGVSDSQTIPLQVAPELLPALASTSTPSLPENALLPFPEGGGNEMYQARQLYQQGIQNSQERNHAFNQALNLLLPLIPNATVDSAIAVLLLQLQEKPLAIYHLKRALKNDPDNSFAYQQLKQLLPETTHPTNLRKPFFICFLLLGCTLLVYLWLGSPLWKWIAIISLLPCLLTTYLLISAIYFSPIEAILLRSTLLHQGPDEKYPPTDLDPLPSASIVTVLATEKKGNWIKVRSDRRMGYVPQKAIRVVP